MKGFTLIFALVLGIQTIHGAEILRGYMVAKGGSVCIKTDETGGIVNSAGGSPWDAAALSGLSCSLMSVKDGETDKYIIEEQGGTDKEMVLADNAATTFGATGTQLAFIKEGTTAALTGITSADVSDLTSSTTSVYVASAADDVDTTDCLKFNGDYAKGDVTSACTDQLWYFVTDTCFSATCKACSADQAKCSECEANEGLNTAMTACVACSDTADCETCSLDSSDNIVCATCGSDKYPTTNGTSCAECGTAISDCTNCTVNSGTTTCLDCGSTKYLTSGGAGCDTCANIISDCSNCTSSSSTTTCTVCGSEKTPSSDGSTCETTTTAATTTASSAVVERASFIALIGIYSLLMTIC